MEWIILDIAVTNFVKLSMSLGEIMFFNHVFGKCQMKVTVVKMTLTASLFLMMFLMGCTPQAQSSQATEQDWIRLFNGQDLSGWTVQCMPQDRQQVFWTVADGAIECNSMGKPKHNYVWLMTEDAYRNFHFRMRFQVFRASKGNSGLQFRSRYDHPASAPDSGWLNGPQVDIHPPNPFRTGLIYDETQGVKRWIWPSLDNWAIEPDQAPPGARQTSLQYAEDDPQAWNTLELICDGMHIITRVNGHVVSDYDATGVLDDAVHQKYNVGTQGKFALQLHMNDELLIRFKDIEILVKDESR